MFLKEAIQSKWYVDLYIFMINLFEGRIVKNLVLTDNIRHIQTKIAGFVSKRLHDNKLIQGT